MTEAPYFHVGILVPDLDEAIARFHDVLGLDFAEPSRSTIPQLDENGISHEWEVHVTYSIQAPHLELIEAAGDGVYGAQNGFGVHHIGGWIADAPAFIDHLTGLGVGTEAVMRNGDTNLGAYFDPAALFGVRFEAVPTLIRPGWESWVTGSGDFDPIAA